MPLTATSSTLYLAPHFRALSEECGAAGLRHGFWQLRVRVVEGHTRVRHILKVRKDQLCAGRRRLRRQDEEEVVLVPGTVLPTLTVQVLHA